MSKIKARIYKTIFEADTKAGRIFDETLLVIIIFSICVVILESVADIRIKYFSILRIIELAITAIFTIEYLARIWVTAKPIKYILSIYGLIDLLALLPTYMAFILSGGQSLLVIRALRLIRVFRILKLTRYSSAGSVIAGALANSKEKITVFMIFVITLVIIIGTIMYLVEGEKNGFTSIPVGIYWAIVTLTTVGYGDISPSTGLGQFLSSVVMILGYAIIAVPTGIVTASMLGKQITNTQVCSNCMFNKHDDDALYCKRCGTSLDK